MDRDKALQSKVAELERWAKGTLRLRLGERVSVQITITKEPFVTATMHGWALDSPITEEEWDSILKLFRDLAAKHVPTGPSGQPQGTWKAREAYHGLDLLETLKRNNNEPFQATYGEDYPADVNSILRARRFPFRVKTEGGKGKAFKTQPCRLVRIA